MIDFVEYVVSELSSKRLSKADALALITQFRLRSPGDPKVAVLHPLLHRNTSDLAQQTYSSTFDGSEFFLRDHQVNGKKLLPGVAYLEMVRAAIRAALPGQDDRRLSLRNVVWAQPIVVDGQVDVSVALFPAEGQAGDARFDYEIYSFHAAPDGAVTQTIHSQGCAVLGAAPDAGPAALDLAQLRTHMRGAELAAPQLYQAYARMGIGYGPTHRGVTRVQRGERQLLAELALPAEAEETLADYMLHPSLLDAALQAALGFAADMNALPRHPSLPFALEVLHLVSPCTRDMFAWLRFAPGSQPGDKVTRIDIDLCDPDGKVCVQLRGFTSRTLDADSGSGSGSLYAVPGWVAADAASAAGAAAPDAGARHLILCGAAGAHLAALAAGLPGSDCLALPETPGQDLAARYQEVATACFLRIKQILASKPQGRVLLQLVAADSGADALLAGLAGMLKTASAENPVLAAQILLADPCCTADALLAQLESARSLPATVVRCAEAGAEVLAWRELDGAAAPAGLAFKERGVYLVTGGLGGLGMLFARSILEQARGATVILAGRSALDGARQERLDGLAGAGGTAGRPFEYRQVDIADAGAVGALVAAIVERHGRLDGIIHAAGMLADGFILNKSAQAFGRVLAPKVAGTFHLDQASKDLDLDFLVLFSAGAAVTGNPGQADYAAANGFMDQFAAYRNGLAARGERQGKTRAINWPLWQDGGMDLDPALRTQLLESAGLVPMASATGLRAFHEILASEHAQVQVVEGRLATLRAALFAQASPAAVAQEPHPLPLDDADAAGLREQTRQFLKKRLSALLKLPAARIDAAAPFEKYGINSIMTMNLTNELEKIFGSLPKTLFFEYQTLAELADYFIGAHAAKLASLFAAPGAARTPAPVALAAPVERTPRAARRFAAPSVGGGAHAARQADPIAIVGLSGRYPGARDLAQYWNNLRDGVDSVAEVPRERWDWRDYFTEDRSKSGQHYSKWGGFIDGVDEFDALFFNIPPVDAERIDPQERLFLQHAWLAIEDAGLTRNSLQVARSGEQAGQVGVYVGVMYGEYQLFGAEASLLGQRSVTPSSYASIANRVSYFLNLHGPSMALDTMCSSSLTAIDLACQDLKQGRTDVAIAGGVNVTVHPNKYLLLSAGQFIATDGRCQSFGVGGDGYIPAEGVGAVILKRLSEAERDGNHIYGVIKGSALNHGGKTNGYSVPNPQSQAGVIARAMREYGVDPRQIGYIEAHGTGTRLGDPIEIAALTQAFRQGGQRHREQQRCLIGSAKSNIGHAESAAGIAGLTKVLLQMQHRQIVPSLHSSTLNAHIDFDSTPFTVNQVLREWEQPQVDGVRRPRMAGISSFGAGGSNAHLIVEEYVAPDPAAPARAEGTLPVALVLSARTPAQLQQKIQDLLAFIRAQDLAPDLEALAYTLQVGREAMEERFGLVVDSAAQLVERLQAWLDGDEQVEDSHRGQAGRGDDALSLFHTDADLKDTVDKWIAGRRLARLLELWARGLEVDWAKLYGAARPRLLSLPTYPFAQERCWFERVEAKAAAALAGPGTQLHPLVHANTSDFSQQSYASTFSGAEFFLDDHRVSIAGGAAERVMPGVAYLEMARAATALALGAQPETASVSLRHLAWIRPLVIPGAGDTPDTRLNIALTAHDDGAIDVEISSLDKGERVVHCQGQAVLRIAAPARQLDLGGIESALTRGRLAAEQVYASYAGVGIEYGPAQRAIVGIGLGDGQVLAQLRLPPGLAAGAAGYLLHPSLMDAAFQAAIGLVDTTDGTPAQARLPFALDALEVLAPGGAEMFAWLRHAPGSTADGAVVKLDIDLCDSTGRVCVEMRGLSSRALVKGAATVSAEPAVSAASGALVAVPVWEAAGAASAGAASREYAGHHVVLCDIAGVDAGQLAALLPGSRCQALHAAPDATPARRYGQHALACFEIVRALLADAASGHVLLQVVGTQDAGGALLAGLSGMLRTAALENPRFAGQLVLTAPGATPADLARQLREVRHSGETLTRYVAGTRQHLRWQELAPAPLPPEAAFKDDGVYLVTGGLGGLGMLFAREILAQTSRATVILTGRAAPDAGTQAILERLAPAPGRLEYRMLDLEDAVQARQLVAASLEKHGQLNGILHSAGMVADSFILKKPAAQFAQVLAPKVTGTANLDDATQDIGLDFFVLFSSLSSAFGNLGQADYAAANGFMDQFAACRNAMVERGQRQGHTLSINWPLWREGGMRIDAASLALLETATGMQALQTAHGMQALYRGLASGHGQALVLEGDLARLRLLIAAQAPLPTVAIVPAAAVTPVASGGLQGAAEAFLREQFAGVLKVPAHRIDPQAPLENYGIDSVLAMKLTSVLEDSFGTLSKTLFFEYQTVSRLAAYFVKAYPVLIPRQGAPASSPAPAALPAALPAAPAIRGAGRFLGASRAATRDVAIVGVGGRYPQAEDLDAFWDNLRSGRDCISDVPAERWDHALYFDADKNKPGKTYSKWGGFLADVDKFDPMFFNISPREAEVMDPQERLFLETAWQTVEDAGYSRESLSGKRIGVYVGAMWGHYELYGAASAAAIPTSSHGSIANRVSYFFNFNGPSIALDTMCSSSLTAIHLASEEIRRGNIDAALAGGVNLSVHPQKYLNLSQGKFAASDGRCRSFGAGGDGYVPGEGVGAVLLKPLEDAVRDGDQVYAVIRSSALNHGGKTNGYTVPNPNAQGELILDALRQADIDPRTLGYIETHGTGTALGDPIEIAGLQQAFAPYTGAQGICPIGSVKSNIGHLESAAGIAAVTKALLQLKHGQLVPSLHAETLNPHIDFAGSPFFVQTALAPWQRHPEHPRRVAVSAFGAGGANAHLILEEYTGMAPGAATVRPELFVLSARNPAALCRYALRVARFLEQDRGESLAAIAYTSQVGRTAMPARLAVVAATIGELKNKLEGWLAATGAASDPAAARMTGTQDVYYGNLNEAQYNAGTLMQGSAGQAFVGELLARRELGQVAGLWSLGAEIDWTLAHGQGRPHRVSLPTYPFARERYWIGAPSATPATAPAPVTVAVAEDKGRTCYRRQWTPCPLPAPLSAPAGPVLILDTGTAFAAAFQALLAPGQAATPVVLARPGSAYGEDGHGFTFDPASHGDVTRMLEALAARGQAPRVILHRYAAPSCLELDGEQVARQLDLGVYTLLAACQALMKQKHHAALKLVTFFDGGEGAPAPLAAALGGFYRTLHLENPHCRPKLVELGGEGDSTEAAAIVLDELLEADWTTGEIRYSRAGPGPCTRSVREYLAFAPAAQRAADLPLKQHGVYLITGGLGGLGFIFADYLATHYQARLVLVGRSAPGPVHEEQLARLRTHGAEVLYLRADVAQPAEAESAVANARARFGAIDGVIHSAGVNRDSFLLRKTREEMDAVLAPKVQGTINLDRATRQEGLDLFVLFSSVAGALGNPGQADYAYANSFLDAFADEREQLRLAGQRSGRTLAIGWPFWEEGGMILGAEAIALSQRHAGIYPLPTAQGIAFWTDFLGSDLSSGLALYGVPSKMAALVANGRRPSAPRPAQLAALATPAADLFAQTQIYLKGLIGEEIKLDPARIDARERLESFGLDSIMVGRLNERLSQDLGALPKTLFYEFETVDELAGYFVRELPQALAAFLAPAGTAQVLADPAPAAVAAPSVADPVPATLRDRAGHAASEPIAIIGMHGRYPQAKDLGEYWEHLRQGSDVVGLVPAARWDFASFYDADPAQAAHGKIYCKWGGFLDGVDEFDAAFFNIEADEARMMDPQERLFLQSVWSAFEDAGYTRERLKRQFPKGRSASVGVFVGVTTNSYNLRHGGEANGGGAAPSALPWSIANRVSYFFDFQGPSMPVDTACSSSSVAIHLACDSLRKGEAALAVAGGVNLYLHPAKYQGLCHRRMLSLGGKCRSYGAGDDGFVPGEGVGSLVLKPLSTALADGDHVHALILASACEHSGRSNGYSAPNPVAQASLIGETLARAGVHPESIGYVEGHGTGTQLGDSLEVAALKQAFARHTGKQGFCALGSVKANQGHTEAAAGIAGTIKIVLQMQHRQLVPTIHSDEVNPNIAFERSPFYLQHGLSPWEQADGQPRRALLNAFGAGGVSACVLLEEYRASGAAPATDGGPQLVLMSAKNEEGLRAYVAAMLAHLDKTAQVDLAALAYTLQVGREAMPERLAVVAADRAQLLAALAGWIGQAARAGVHRGSVDPRLGARRATRTEQDRLDALLAARDLDGLAEAWLGGAAIAWDKLHAQARPIPMPLPTYPFARERHWVEAPLVTPAPVPPAARLHPLISHNSSTLREVSFSSMLSGSAFYARDHQVNGQGIFPGAGFLEMACVAGALAGTRTVRTIRDVVFIQPLVFADEAQMVQVSLRAAGDDAEYIITSYDAERDKVVHSEGVIVGGEHSQAAPERLSIDGLKGRCGAPRDGADYYARFAQAGIVYGPAFRSIGQVWAGDAFALSRLAIADAMKADFDQFVLHPCLVDGALQTVAGLAGEADESVPYLPFAIDEISIAGPLPQDCYVLVEEVDAAQGGKAGIRKFDIRIMNEAGLVLVVLKRFSVRAFRAVPQQRMSTAAAGA